MIPLQPKCYKEIANINKIKINDAFGIVDFLYLKEYSKLYKAVAVCPVRVKPFAPDGRFVEKAVGAHPIIFAVT